MLYCITPCLILFGYLVKLVAHIFSSDEAGGRVHVQLSWSWDLNWMFVEFRSSLWKIRTPHISTVRGWATAPTCSPLCLIQPRSIAEPVTIVQMSECLSCIASSFSVSSRHLFLPLQRPWNSDNVLHLCRKAIDFVCAGHFFVSGHRAHVIFFSFPNRGRPRICCCGSLFVTVMSQYLISVSRGRNFYCSLCFDGYALVNIVSADSGPMWGWGWYMKNCSAYGSWKAQVRISYRGRHWRWTGTGFKNEPEISFVGRTASSDLLPCPPLLNSPWASTPEPVGIFHNENIITV